MDIVARNCEPDVSTVCAIKPACQSWDMQDVGLPTRAWSNGRHYIGLLDQSFDVNWML